MAARTRTPVLVAVVTAVGVVLAASVPAIRDVIAQWLARPQPLRYQGAVRSATSNLPVKGAVVTAIGRSDVSPAQTDDFGNFVLTLPQSPDGLSIRIQVVAAGYEEFNRSVNLERGQVDSSLLIEPRATPAPIPTPVVQRWPDGWTDLQTADLQVSDIDDYMAVTVNGTPIIRAQYGETPPWMSFRHLLHRGQNRIEVVIQNDRYGGCGGTLTLRLNGVENPAYRWTWGTQENKPPDIVCFQQVKTLNLE